MPTSYPSNISTIAEMMEAARPDSMLDVGPGYGKFGFLFRERCDDFKWEKRLYGVEIFPEYLRRAHTGFLYDEVHECSFAAPSSNLDMRLILNRAPYGLVMMVDVLEHFSDQEGEIVLRRALQLSPFTIISTPLNYEQGPSHGNEYERHVSEWPVEKIEAVAAQYPNARFQGGVTTNGTNSVIGFLTRPR